MSHLIFLLECRLLFYSWHVLHGQALPGSMSGSLKTILRGSTSRVNLPNAQSNDCGRSSTNDGNGNATGRDLSSGSLNAPPRLWQLPYTKNGGSEYQVRNNSAPDISCRWFVF